MSGSHSAWLEVVERLIGGAPRDKMLDICCGNCAVTRHLGYAEVLGVDCEPRSKEMPATWTFLQADVVPFMKKLAPGCDLAICSDGLEHLTTADGRSLLREMARVSQLAIVFTPTGDLHFDPKAKGPHFHKSSWDHQDFAVLGWETLEFPNWHPTIGLGAIFAWKRKT